MELVSVNVGRPRDVHISGKSVSTAISKEPLHCRVMVRRLGVEGDGQADREAHGGVDQAVYAYPQEHYGYWESALKREAFPFGQFGENFTVRGLNEETVRVGDVLRIGGARLQVSQPRIPCYKLAYRMAEGADFPKIFLRSKRTGFMLRVLAEGEVGPGDAIETESSVSEAATIAEFVHVAHFDTRNALELRRLLASPDLSAEWRRKFEDMLRRAAGGAQNSG